MSNSARSRHPGLDDEADRAIGIIRRWSHISDKAFRIPGTKFRFGWDPLIGLVPGLGDLLTALASLFLLTLAFRLRVPHIIKARMILNVLIDVTVGAIPLIGDLFDFVWKSNSLNLALLEKHAGAGAGPGIGDWAFVLGTVAAVVAIVAIPILVVVWLLQLLQTWIDGPSLWNI